MTMPNFLIIGANKAGTSSLYEYLKQHPEIYMSHAKEPSFFMLDGIKVNTNRPDMPKSMINNIEDYLDLFKEVTNEKAIGEASTAYLPNPNAVKRIQYYIPDTKLIAILRDPVERAYSAYSMYAQRGWEPIYSFTRAVEEENVSNNWHHYVKLGFYYTQLKRYFDTFNKNQIKIYLYEDYLDNPANVLKDIFQFLDVDDSFVPSLSSRTNVTATPRNKVLHSLITRPNPILKAALKSFIPSRLSKRVINVIVKKNLVEGKPKLSPNVRRKLIEKYREDILKLQDLLQRDFSHWLE